MNTLVEFTFEITDNKTKWKVKLDKELVENYLNNTPDGEPIIFEGDFTEKEHGFAKSLLDVARICNEEKGKLQNLLEKL